MPDVHRLAQRRAWEGEVHRDQRTEAVAEEVDLAARVFLQEIIEGAFDHPGDAGGVPFILRVR